MPTAYNICTKCCVIKVVFLLAFFFFVWLITMYKKDKVAPLNLPLPFTWAVSPFFPSGAPHTPLPRGRKPLVPGKVGGGDSSPCTLCFHPLPPALPVVGGTGAK